MAKKDNVPRTGKAVTEQMANTDKALHKASFDVARAVVVQFREALEVFSGTGGVGNAINASAPAILNNDQMVLPVIAPLTAGQRAATNLELFYAIMDPTFKNALSGFQKRLVRCDIDGQVELLRQFTSIDWSAVSGIKPTDTSVMAKVNNFLYYNSQMIGVRNAKLEQLVVLTKVPQFVQLLTLAGGYGKLMLAAYAAFSEARNSLGVNDEENKEIVGTLDGILERFTVADEKRRQSILDIKENSKLLEEALELTKKLTLLDERAEEMLSRINIDKKLVMAMAENNQQTVAAELAQLEELVKSFHILSSNQARKAEVTDAMLSLDLYVKCYIIFEMILTMLQVYLLAASSAVKTLTAERIQAAGEEVGRDFYKKNVDPLQNVIDRYVSNFRAPAISAFQGEGPDYDEAQLLKKLEGKVVDGVTK